MNVICIADGRAFESHGRALSFVFALKGNEKKKQKKSRLSKRLISFHIMRLAFPLLRPTDGFKKKKVWRCLINEKEMDRTLETKGGHSKMFEKRGGGAFLSLTKKILFKTSPNDVNSKRLSERCRMNCGWRK